MRAARRGGAGARPCERVDLSHGEEAGAALLKDLVGRAQFLAIPTRRVTGIEDPLLLDPAAPDYFAFAWGARDAVADAARAPAAREATVIALNSKFRAARTSFICTSIASTPASPPRSPSIKAQSTRPGGR